MGNLTGETLQPFGDVDLGWDGAHRARTPTGEDGEIVGWPVGDGEILNRCGPLTGTHHLDEHRTGTSRSGLGPLGEQVVFDVMTAVDLLGPGRVC
jgi:hypothetical protein